MHIDAGQKLQDLRAKDPLIAKEWNDFQKLKDDPRVSKFGKFMRETSIDELPQIFNVLLGQMSIVGPRPFMLSQDSLYREAGGAYFISCARELQAGGRLMGAAAQHLWTELDSTTNMPQRYLCLRT